MMMITLMFDVRLEDESSLLIYFSFGDVFLWLVVSIRV